MKQRTIYTSPRIMEVEKAFAEINVFSPIVQFIEYDEKKMEDVYLDQKTGEKVRISTVKEVIPCAICAKRDNMRKKLEKEVERMKPSNHAEFVEHWNREKDLFLKKHKECEACGGVVGSSTADFEGTAHTHVCEGCNLHYPREVGVVYEGGYSDPSLERDE